MILQTSVNIEGVVITPEIHAFLMDMQCFPESLTSPVKDAEDLILTDWDENSPERILEVMRGLHFLGKKLNGIIIKQEGGVV